MSRKQKSARHRHPDLNPEYDTDTRNHLLSGTEADANTEAISGRTEAGANTEAISGRTEAGANTEAISGRTEAGANTETASGRTEADANTTVYHVPVLLHESIEALITDPDGIYADATFGGGGHSRAILERLGGNGRLLAFDQDEDAVRNCGIKDDRLILVRNNFRFIENFAIFEKSRLMTGRKDTQKTNQSAFLDGILADLGVSSHQFDTAERGFSFRFDAPLDMRMNSEAGMSAADIVNGYEEEDIEKILRLYGEVENSRKLANLICKARESKAISTTGDLQNAMAPALPKFAEHKALAKIFQALRIEVNHEMKSLEKFLYGAAAVLKPGGRLAVITYHSLEDRMVKNFIKSGNISGDMEKDMFGNVKAPLKAVNRKPIVPAETEISANTRARSAKLRIAERI